MKITKRQKEIVKLMQEGYPLIIGLSETTGQPYYMIASTHNNGYGNTYFNATVFSNLLAKKLIYQYKDQYELTPDGENIN